MNDNMSKIAKSVSSNTITAMNNFIDVTGFVYGVVNLLAPTVTLPSQNQVDQTHYDNFCTALSSYKLQAGLWIQPTASQTSDIVSMITALPQAITGISSVVISDLNTLKALGPGSSADSVFCNDAKTKITAAKTTVNNMISAINTFVSNVTTVNRDMNVAYKGILATVDTDLEQDIQSLTSLINSLKGQVQAKQQKLSSNDTGRDIAIAVTVISIFTFGIGGAVIGAAGIALSSSDINALKDEIKGLQDTINNKFNTLDADQQAKAAVILFQQEVLNSIEAHAPAVDALENFLTYLDNMEDTIEEIYSDLTELKDGDSTPIWNEYLQQALTDWTQLDVLAVALADIKISANPYLFDGNTVRITISNGYLNGHTQTGQVDVMNSTSYSGTNWQIEELENGRVAFKCLGNIRNANHIYLNGHTQDGIVDIVQAPTPKNPLTGTRWEAVALGDVYIAFKCMGQIINPDHVYLNWDSQNNTVSLVSEAGISQPGARWQMQPNGVT